MDAQDIAGAITGGPGQLDRLLKLDTPLADNTLLPQRVVGHSRIGRHYSFTVDMVSVADGIELKTLIAQPVTLWIAQTDGSYAPHHGYVHSARRLGSDGTLTSYQITFSPWMHFLHFRKDARIWQDQSADAILTDVFNAHPQAQGAFRFVLGTPLPQRSFCVQYETDWNFVHRLLEEEGLFGYFEQAEDGKSHTLVVTDSLDTLSPVSPQTVDFYRAGANAETDALVQWSGTRTLQRATLTTRSFDYKAPPSAGNTKGTTVPALGNQGQLPSQAEMYHYTGAYSFGDQSRGDQLSKIRMEEWESQAKRFEGAGGVRRLDAGRWFEFTDHPAHADDSEQQRQFAIIETRWYIQNNLPMSSQAPDFPHSLEREIEAVKAQQAGGTGASAALNGSSASNGSNASNATGGVLDALKVSASDGGEGFFLAKIEAQRKNVPYHSPFEHAKPKMHLQTALVVGPANEEVYTDSLNRIKVQMHWDRLNPGDEKASCWVRVIQSDAGDGHGGVHPPRIGEEVVIGWMDGDCDRPIATGRLYNGKATPDWHSNGLLSGYKSKEYGGSGFNQLVMDDATGQNRVQMFSSSANSQLHMGYLVAQDGNSRGPLLGSGFDLKSDAYGAVRAGQGLYASTHPAGGTGSQPLDVSPAQTQLNQASGALAGMSGASVAGQAESLQDGADALSHFLAATSFSTAGGTAGAATGSSASNASTTTGSKAVGATSSSGSASGAGSTSSTSATSNTGGSGTSTASSSTPSTAGGGTGSANVFKEPLMLLASPAGMALSTQMSTQVTTGQQLNLVSGENIHIAAGKSLIASVAEKISLFAQGGGMKWFAAKGKVEIQAHLDNIEVTSQQKLQVLSATESVEIAAGKDILLTSGGAYIRITGGNIEIHAPGKIDIKGAQHSFDGPARADYPLPALPTSQYGAAMQYLYHDDEPVQGATYVATLSDGSKREGTLDAQGRLNLQDVPSGVVQVELGPDARAYSRKDQTQNPDYKGSQLSDSDINALIAKHGGA
jgi:type VI secretion system secreted protein VgrG